MQIAETNGRQYVPEESITLVRNPRDQKAHERLRSRLVDNIKMDFKGTHWIHPVSLDSSNVFPLDPF
jgi:hypothetical protein